MLKSIVNSPIKSGDQTILAGNLVIGTSGNGIDFSSNSHAGGMTSELLSDYEEGTFTATLTGSTGAPTTPVTETGKYTKIGRQVTVSVVFTNVDTTGATGNLKLTGLPFVASSSPPDYYQGSAAQFGFGGSAITAHTFPGSSEVLFTTTQGLNNVSVSAGSGRYVWVTLTYFA